MASPTYAQNKIHIYNYRLKNIEKWRDADRVRQNKKYAWKKISTTFLNILLEN
jgi:hypothetical protein